MSDFKDAWDWFIEALNKTKHSIKENWESFFVLFFIYTIIIFILFRAYYKRKSEHLSDWDAALKRESARIKSEAKDNEILKKENKEMREKLESDEYQAFLLSRNNYSEDLTDSNMFCKK